MTIGIDVNFFLPSLPNEKRKGRLYLDYEGKNYLEFPCSFADMFEVKSVYHAEETNTGQTYTLVNCVFKHSMHGSCHYLVNELYKGPFLKSVLSQDCSQVEASFTGLTEWINHPRMIPNITFSANEESNVQILPAFLASFPIRPGMALELRTYCGETYDKRETVLRNKSNFRISADEPVSRFELYKDAAAFFKLVSTMTDQIPIFTQLEFQLLDEKWVECMLTKKSASEENDSLLSFNLLEPYWPEAIGLFYQRRDDFVQVIDLLNESRRNRTAEVSFLNITTAYEVFHKHFHERDNEALRKELASELKQRGLGTGNDKTWEQIARYLHLFRLIGKLEYIQRNFLDVFKTIKRIRDSRNYYTHYTKTDKEIWTPNKLFYINSELRQILYAAILKELHIPDNLIHQLLNARAAIFYSDYESNEYSINYIAAKRDLDVG